MSYKKTTVRQWIVKEGKVGNEMNYTNAVVQQLIIAAFFNAVNEGLDKEKGHTFFSGVSAMAGAMIELIMQDEEGGNE